jgi:hypothetical protein
MGDSNENSNTTSQNISTNVNFFGESAVQTREVTIDDDPPPSEPQPVPVYPIVEPEEPVKYPPSHKQRISFVYPKILLEREAPIPVLTKEERELKTYRFVIASLSKGLCLKKKSLFVLQVQDLIKFLSLLLDVKESEIAIEAIDIPIGGGCCASIESILYDIADVKIKGADFRIAYNDIYNSIAENFKIDITHVKNGLIEGVSV